VLLGCTGLLGTMILQRMAGIPIRDLDILVKQL